MISTPFLPLVEVNTMKSPFIRRIVAWGRKIAELHIPMYASQASFFLALSVFPMLVLLMGLLRYTSLDVQDLTEMLHGILPTALMPAAQRLIQNTYDSVGGTVISISAITALWSASRGMHGLRAGLNAICGVEESRGYLYTRLISVVYTILFILTLLLTLILHVFGTSLLSWPPLTESPLFSFIENIIDLRFFLLLALQTGLFTAMFAVLPNKRSRPGQVFPGAVLAALGWLIFSQLYSVYVERFATLSNVFGSMYAVALSLLWLYFCICIVFYGGALNQWIQSSDKKKGDTPPA